MGYRIRTTLDCLHSEYAPERPLSSSQMLRGFGLEAPVYARNYTSYPLWLLGKVIGITGPCSYEVEFRGWKGVEVAHKSVKGPPGHHKYADTSTGPDQTWVMGAATRHTRHHKVRCWDRWPIRELSCSSQCVSSDGWPKSGGPSRREVMQLPINARAQRSQPASSPAEGTLRTSGQIQWHPADYACNV